MVERYRNYIYGTILCTQCGSSNEMENKFCDSCGVDLDKVDLNSNRYFSKETITNSSSIKSKRFLLKNYLGLVFGLSSILVNLIVVIIPFINLIIISICALVSLIGMFLSIITFQENSTLGTAGIIANGLSFVMLFITHLFFIVALY